MLCGAIIIRDDVCVDSKLQTEYAWNSLFSFLLCSSLGALKSRHCNLGTSRNATLGFDQARVMHRHGSLPHSL